MAFLNIKAFLGLDGSGFALGIKRAESTAKQFAREFKGQIAAAFGTAALVAFSKKIIDSADNLLDLEKRLGVNTDILQEWEYAAKKNGAALDDVVSFFENIAKARERALGGSEEDLIAFQRLGVTAKDLLGRTNQIGSVIGGTIKNGDVQSLLGSLTKVGGKGSANLITAFKDGLDGAAQAAHEAGQVLSVDTLFALKSVKTEAQLLADTLKGPLAKGLSLITDTFRNIIVQAKAAKAFWDVITGKNGPKNPSPFPMPGGYNAPNSEGPNLAFPGADGAGPSLSSGVEKTLSKIDEAAEAYKRVVDEADKDADDARKRMMQTRDAMTTGAFDASGFLNQGKGRIISPQVNELQKIGALVLDEPVISEQKKSNILLSKIASEIQKTNQALQGNFSGGGSVEF